MVRVFCGLDVSRRRSEAAVVDDEGRLLGNRRVDDGVVGLAEFCSLLVPHIGAPDMNVDVAVRTGSGPLPAAVAAAGHRVWAVDPDALHVYRMRDTERRGGSDAVLLANVLRVDGLACRHFGEAQALPEQAAPLARAVQALVWSRHQDVDALRLLLREFFPAALVAFPDLAAPTALRTLARAATPAEAMRITIEDLGKIRGDDEGSTQADVERVAGVLQTARPRRPDEVEQALGSAVIAAVSSLQANNGALLELERALENALEPGSGRETAARTASPAGRRRADNGRQASPLSAPATGSGAATGGDPAAGPSTVPGPLGPTLGKRRPADRPDSVMPHAASIAPADHTRGPETPVIPGFKPGAARPVRETSIPTPAGQAPAAGPTAQAVTTPAGSVTGRSPSLPAHTMPGSTQLTDSGGASAAKASHVDAGSVHPGETKATLPRRVPGGRPIPTGLPVENPTETSGGRPLDRSGSGLPAAERAPQTTADAARTDAARTDAARADAARTSSALPKPFSPRRAVMDPEGLPIFAEVQSAWFHEPDLVEAVSDGSHGPGQPTDWASPADEGWRAAEAASKTPAVNGRTQAGLPMRRPQANLIPGAALAKRSESTGSQLRSRALRPDVVRTLLSSYHQGFRQGREEAGSVARRVPSLGNPGYTGASR